MGGERSGWQSSRDQNFHGRTDWDDDQGGDKSKAPVTQKQLSAVVRFYQWESMHWRRVAADVNNIKHKSETANGNSRK